MPSSTSSSDTSGLERTVPAGRWIGPVVVALLVFAIAVIALEVQLARRDIHPTASDSAWAWGLERMRADQFGERALALIGSSRMLLDVDLDVLRDATKLEPVQLSIDGSGFVPVLENLAADDAFRGTVLVGYEDNVVASADADAVAAEYVGAWQHQLGARGMPTFASIEGRLTYLLHASLRSYADGARPGTSVRTRAFARESTPQYLFTFAHRERIADYNRVPMPAFYFTRVLKELHEDVAMRSGMTWGDADKEIRRRLESMPAEDDATFRARVHHIAELVATLQARGAKVVFVELPASGLIRAIEDKRYPKDRFWDRLVAEAGAPAVRTRDDSVLAAFNCPDGSHIDVRERPRFTAALAAFLKVGSTGTR